MIHHFFLGGPEFWCTPFVRSIFKYDTKIVAFNTDIIPLLLQHESYTEIKSRMFAQWKCHDVKYPYYYTIEKKSVLAITEA